MFAPAVALLVGGVSGVPAISATGPDVSGSYALTISPFTQFRYSLTLVQADDGTLIGSLVNLTSRCTATVSGQVDSPMDPLFFASVQFGGTWGGAGCVDDQPSFVGQATFSDTIQGDFNNNCAVVTNNSCVPAVGTFLAERVGDIETTPMMQGIHIELERPRPGDQTQPGAYQLSGIAFDPIADAGTGIDRVQVFLDNRDLGGKYLGDAAIGQPSPLGVPSTQFETAGFTLAVDLPNTAVGSHEIFVYAHSVVTDSEGVVSVPLLIAAAAPVPGQVILFDDFHDASVGWLPASPNSAAAHPGVRFSSWRNASPLGSAPSDFSPPFSFSAGYVAGEYEIRKLDPSQDADGHLVWPSGYANTSIDVDAHLIASDQRTFFWLTCRHQGPVESLYMWALRPDARTFNLRRGDNGTYVYLIRDTISDKILPSPASNHFQLTCAGSSISMAINGTVVGSVQDATYKEGSLRIGTGGRAGAPAVVRLSKLVLTQR